MKSPVQAVVFLVAVAAVFFAGFFVNKFVMTAKLTECQKKLVTEKVDLARVKGRLRVKAKKVRKLKLKIAAPVPVPAPKKTAPAPAATP